MLTDIKRKTFETELDLSDYLNFYVNPGIIYVDPGIKFIQMIYSLKPLRPWFSNFPCIMTRLQGFRIIKFRLVWNQKWPRLLKIAEPLKLTFPPEPLVYLAKISYTALVAP